MVQIATTSRIWRRMALAACTGAGLAGCGGGGGGSSAVPDTNTGVPAAATATFTASQAAATALVRDIEQRTRDLQLAKGLTAASLAGGSSTPSDRVSILAASDQAKPLSLIDYGGTLCSAGTASLDIADALLQRFTDPKATLQPGDTLGLVATQCVIKADPQLTDVTVGNFGIGSTIAGRFDLTLAVRSGDDIEWRLVYKAFRYTPYGGAAFDALDATLVYGSVGGQAIYTLDIPLTRFLSVPTVGAANSVVTVSGKLRGQLPATSGNGYADYSYAAWVFDTQALRANLGTVKLAGVAPAAATVTASATGYAVSITTASGTTNYTVPR